MALLFCNKCCIFTHYVSELFVTELLLMLQLNDVTLGGATVFPKINVGANPIKVMSNRLLTKCFIVQ